MTMQMRSDDHKKLTDAARGVLGLVKERGLSDDPRVRLLTQTLDEQNRIPDLRKAAAAAASARS